MNDTEKRINSIGDSDESAATRSERVAFFLICLVFAPLCTLLLNEVYEDEGAHGVMLILGADLLYASIVGSLFVWGAQLRAAINSTGEALLELWAKIDPSIVWEPWQVVVLSFIISAAFLLIGYRGVFSGNDTSGESHD